MRVRRDLTADAAYVQFMDEPIARTEELEDGTVVDLADDGMLVGIEVFAVSRGWNPELLQARWGLTAAEVGTLRQLTANASVAASGPGPVRRRSSATDVVGEGAGQSTDFAGAGSTRVLKAV